MKLQYCVNRTGAIPPEKLALTGLEVQKAARAFHSTIPGYEATPLTALDHLARRLGVAQVLVKDESKRFGLNAFKALGGQLCHGPASGGTAGAVPGPAHL